MYKHNSKKQFRFYKFSGIENKGLSTKKISIKLFFQIMRCYKIDNIKI